MSNTPIFYAIGDIHGDLDQLLAIHARINEDRKSNNVSDYQIVHVGDLVDRRPDSKGVIDFLMAGIADGEPWTVLKGNHDRLFQWFMETPHRADDRLRSDYNWLHHRMGGRETLESYGITFPLEDYDIDAVHAEALKIVPNAHYEFIRNLPLMLDIGEFIIVHAGINPYTRKSMTKTKATCCGSAPVSLITKNPSSKRSSTATRSSNKPPITATASTSTRVLHGATQCQPS